MGGELLFPWWLWLLMAAWSLAIVVLATLPTASEWKRPLQVMAGAYTALLWYVAARPVNGHGAMTLMTVGLGLISAATLGGGLLHRLSTQKPHQLGGLTLALCGLSALAAVVDAMETAVLILLLLPYPIPATSAMSHVAATDPYPLRDRWLLVVTATLFGGLTLGLLQYSFRVEAHRPAASNWYTARPSSAAIDAVREQTPPGKISLPWSTAAIIVALLSLEIPRRRSRKPTSPADATSAPVVSPALPVLPASREPSSGSEGDTHASSVRTDAERPALPPKTSDGARPTDV